MDQIGRFVQKYLYDPEPMNENPNEPIICLGETYTASQPHEAPGHAPWPNDFLQDHDARFWFTYRTGFEKILREPKEQTIALKFGIDGFTADTGFGCMIRAAQTLLANAISVVKLGRDWRRGLRQDIETEILRMFADDPEAPFSVHRFIRYGAVACDKPAGQWFGPNAASLCISALSERYASCGLKVYVASEQGGTIYEDHVLDIAGADFDPVLILVPQRLGHERINPRYHDAVKALFAQRPFVGIAGGRPSSAHYFFARQMSKLFFLDPHFPRPSLPYHSDLARYSDTDLDGVHTRRVRTVSLEDMDPSMLLGFVFQTRNEWDQWKTMLEGQSGSIKVVAVSRTSMQTQQRSRDISEADESEIMSEEEGPQ